MVGPVEADPEYQLIVESNNFVVEIDNEISEWLEGKRVWLDGGWGPMTQRYAELK